MDTGAPFARSATSVQTRAARSPVTLTPAGPDLAQSHPGAYVQPVRIDVGPDTNTRSPPRRSPARS